MPAEDIKNHVLKWRDFLMDALFPLECLGCGKEGSWICPDCFEKLRSRQSQYCLVCKKPSPTGKFCAKCSQDFHLDGILIAGDYQDQVLSRAIKILKYRFAKPIAPLLSGILMKNWSENEKYIKKELKTAGLLIIPVPLHPRRERWRGFNQSKLLAECLLINGSVLDSGSLARVRNTKPQTSFDRARRRENIKDSFVWQGPGISGDVLLVDDVTTTGATLDECAKILKKNGARKIWALVLANG